MLTRETAPTTAPVELDFDARLAGTDAEMTLRMETAGLAADVNAAAPETVVDLADVITGPVAVPNLYPTPYPTPVAGLLQRALTRLTDGGWCRGAMRHTDGGLCLAEAVRQAAGGDAGLEIRGLNHLLDQIRRDLDPRAATVPAWNDAQRDGRMPLRILDTAANTAHQRGI